MTPFVLDTFEPVGPRTNVHWHPKFLANLPCGMFRASQQELAFLLPELHELYATFPMDNPEDYEFDIKIHMLMPNQYPCVPNWHCDNVPRDINGALHYERIKEYPQEPMYLWISQGPHTEFLSKRVELPSTPQNHVEVADFIEGTKKRMGDGQLTTHIPDQQWIKFSTKAPHRGIASDSHQWRVFCRATHHSIAPVRPKVSPLRRHCQVYLDSAKFGW